MPLLVDRHSGVDFVWLLWEKSDNRHSCHWQWMLASDSLVNQQIFTNISPIKTARAFQCNRFDDVGFEPMFPVLEFFDLCIQTIDNLLTTHFLPLKLTPPESSDGVI